MHIHYMQICRYMRTLVSLFLHWGVWTAPWSSSAPHPASRWSQVWYAEQAASRRFREDGLEDLKLCQRRAGGQSTYYSWRSRCGETNEAIIVTFCRSKWTPRYLHPEETKQLIFWRSSGTLNNALGAHFFLPGFHAGGAGFLLGFRITGFWLKWIRYTWFWHFT